MTSEGQRSRSNRKMFKIYSIGLKYYIRIIFLQKTANIIIKNIFFLNLTFIVDFHFKDDIRQAREFTITYITEQLEFITSIKS